MTLPPLSADLSAKIKAHLDASYAGMFTPEAIRAHLDEFVGGNEAAGFWQQIQPLLGGQKKILDIGSGYGAFVLTARQNGYDAIGLELAEFDNQCARVRLVQIEPNADASKIFVLGSALALPFPDESFDIVTFWNVIEHVPDYNKALSEAARVLKKGGHIVIEAPNYASFRKEAHYHVPWLPFFPKSLASLYLKALGRNPSFLNNDIYYCTVSGVTRSLHKNGCAVSSLTHEKFLRPEYIGRSSIRGAVERLKRYKLEFLLVRFLNLKQLFPLRPSIQCIACKQ
jgi:SAM-dependent methyltransferase